MNDISNVDAPPLVLSIGINAVRCSDGVALLDVVQDRYLCVYDPISPEGGHRVTAPIATRAVHALLTEHGFASAAPLTDALAAHHAYVTTIVQRDDIAVPLLPLHMQDIGRFTLALLRAAITFQRSSFAELLDHVRKRDASVEPPLEPVRTAQVIAQFERLSLWLPFRFDCLFRSFFLIHFLTAHRLRPDWIFGVSLFPFAAHCWLADHDVLLGERAHRIEGYTPIFRITGASA